MNEFNVKINRANTQSYKWDYYGDEANIIQMWVADMDFLSPPALLKAFEERVKHGIFGYTCHSAAYTQILADYISRAHGYKADRDWIVPCPTGVVPSLGMILDLITDKNDCIIMQTPNYGPLFNIVRSRGRILIENPLVVQPDGYKIDFELLIRQIRQHKPKVMIFTSPHNPTGRVWTQNELEKIAKICKQYDITVINDEVHCDLIYEPNKFVSLTSYHTNGLKAVSLFSPNKTFNTGGLMSAAAVIPDTDLRLRFKQQLSDVQIAIDATFGAIAGEVLYGDETCWHWKNKLLIYLQKNIDFTCDFLSKNLSKITFIKPQGTYLMFLDFSGYGLSGEKLQELLLKKAKVRLYPGSSFGSGFDSFMRINLACPLDVVKEALERIQAAITEIDCKRLRK